MRFATIAVVLVFLLVVITACGSPRTTTTPAATTSPPATTALTTTAASTFGDHAASGRTVFSQRCAGCHGANAQGGTGPRLIGSGHNLGKYNTARGLFDFISTSMPANAPGSLPRDDYLNVLSFILTENGFVQGGEAFDAAKLPNIRVSP